MVLLTGDGKGSGECRGPTVGKLLHLPPSSESGAQPGGPGVEAKRDPVALDERVGGDGNGAGTGDDDDYEEYEDFSVLPETHSIASGDSFYPPQSDDDEGDDWSLGESDPSDSPEPPLTLFRACCTNNVLVLRTLIRQGLEEEAVRETDRNKRLLAASPPPPPAFLLALSASHMANGKQPASAQPLPRPANCPQQKSWVFAAVLAAREEMHKRDSGVMVGSSGLLAP
ncbi:hypothetical protein lerEdw1_015037 [Lerista edwardsae]|nr:hypothetical protein lerEdw1_015037 [Lerista edwardsae]